MASLGLGGKGWGVASLGVRQTISSAATRGSRTPIRLPSRRRFSPLAWYNKQIERSPLVTKCITSGVLFSTGDILAQTVTMEKGGKYDLPRVSRAAVFGTLLLGPLAHAHFNFIEWLTVKKLSFTGVKMAFSKMFIDQFTYWATGINIVYLFSLPLMAGEPRVKAWENVKVNLWPVLKANWCLWPIAQLINFRLIPVVHQLNFVLVISLGWATYLSWSTSERPAASAHARDKSTPS